MRSTSAIARLGRLILKEEREILRDRRTLVTLFVMPLLLYPLLNVAVQQFLTAGLKRDSRIVYRFGVRTEDDGNLFLGLLQVADRAKPYEQPTPKNSAAAGATVETPLPRIELEMRTEPELRELLKAGVVDALIFPTAGSPRELDPRSPLVLDLDYVYVEGRSTAEAALTFIRGRISVASQKMLERRLQVVRVQQRPEPVVLKFERLPSPDQNSSGPLTTVLPLVLILMTITGAVYPAIDLTAGERERGTLEVLMAAPIPRMQLLLAKYVAVVTVAMLTALVNLCAMAAAIYFGDIGPLLFTGGSLTPNVIAQALAALVLLAAFFSAVLLAVTSFARSFKEAQAYLVPLMLVALAPGVVSLFPWLELTPELAVVPLLNIVLLSRELTRGFGDWATTALVLASTAFYAGAALAVAARLFGSENVLYGSGSFWSGGSAETSKSNEPSIQDAALLVGIALPAFLWLNGAAAKLAGAELRPRLASSAAVLALVFGGLALWATGLRSPLKSLRLVPPHPLALVAGLLLGLSLWPFAFEILRFQGSLTGVGENEALHKRIEGAVEQLRAIPIWQRLLIVAAIPAVFEEIFFRGYVLTALRTKFKPWTAIATSAVVFGMFHVVSPHGLTPERLLPTALLGIPLGWLALRSGSIIPGMILHVCHNGLLMLVVYDLQRFSQITGWTDAKVVPWKLLAVAGLLVLAGVGAGLGVRRKTATED